MKVLLVWKIGVFLWVQIWLLEAGIEPRTSNGTGTAVVYIYVIRLVILTLVEAVVNQWLVPQSYNAEVAFQAQSRMHQEDHLT